MGATGIGIDPALAGSLVVALLAALGCVWRWGFAAGQNAILEGEIDTLYRRLGLIGDEAKMADYKIDRVEAELARRIDMVERDLAGVERRVG